MIVNVKKIKELKEKGGCSAEKIIFLVKALGVEETEKLIDLIKGDENVLIKYINYDFDTFVEIYNRWGVEKLKNFCNTSVNSSPYDVREMLRYSDEILNFSKISYEDFIEILLSGITYSDLIKRLNVAQLKVIAKWLNSQQRMLLSKKRDLCREINMLLTEFPHQPLEKILKAIEYQEEIEKRFDMCISITRAFFDDNWENAYNAYVNFVKELPSTIDRDNLKDFSNMLFKYLSPEQIVKFLKWNPVEIINKWKSIKEDIAKIANEQLLGEFINSAESLEDFKETINNWKSLNGVMTGEIEASKSNKTSYEQMIKGKFPLDIAEEIINEKILSIAHYFSDGYEIPITAKIVKEFKKAIQEKKVDKNSLRRRYQEAIKRLMTDIHYSKISYNVWDFIKNNETEIADVFITMTQKNYSADYAYWEPFVEIFKQTGDSEVFKIALINLKTREIKYAKDCYEVLKELNIPITVENMKCASALICENFSKDEIKAMYEYYKETLNF